MQASPRRTVARSLPRLIARFTHVAGLLGPISPHHFLVALGIAAMAVLAGVAFEVPRIAPGQIFAASVSERKPSCPRPEVARAVLSGQRLRLSGSGPITPGCGIWATILDPRTGSLWVQGPARETGPGWVLNLVLGTSAESDPSLRYEVSLAALPPPAHERWVSVALQGQPVALEGALPGAWLAHRFSVIVESRNPGERAV